MHLLHLRGRKTSDFLLRKGKVWKSATFVAYWLPGPPRRTQIDATRQALYVGTFASAKLHSSAVARNRMRRRIREALRVAVKDQAQIPTAQLLLSPRSASLKAPFADIERDVRALLTLLSSSWPTQKKEK